MSQNNLQHLSESDVCYGYSAILYMDFFVKRSKTSKPKELKSLINQGICGNTSLLRCFRRDILKSSKSLIKHQICGNTSLLRCFERIKKKVINIK
jgi:hypothetical protein